MSQQTRGPPCELHVTGILDVGSGSWFGICVDRADRAEDRELGARVWRVRFLL